MEENSRPSSSLRWSERARLGLATLFGLVCGFSCMSSSPSPREIVSPPPPPAPPGTVTLRQAGSLNLGQSTKNPVTVYYPRPYISPPNLVISSSSGGLAAAAEAIEIIEQKPDHFTYRTQLPGPPIGFGWVAEGVPLVVAAVAPPAPPPAPAAVNLPAAPPPPVALPAPPNPPEIIIQTGGK